MMSRNELLDRMARSLQAWQRALGRPAAGGAVLHIGPFGLVYARLGYADLGAYLLWEHRVSRPRGWPHAEPLS